MEKTRRLKDVMGYTTDQVEELTMFYWMEWVNHNTTSVQGFQALLCNAPVKNWYNAQAKTQLKKFMTIANSMEACGTQVNKQIYLTLLDNYMRTLLKLKPPIDNLPFKVQLKTISDSRLKIHLYTQLNNN